MRSNWKERRRAGITATDVAAILGVSTWKNALDVQQEKLLGQESIAETDFMRMGRALEPIIVKMYERKTGHTVRRFRQVRQSKRNPLLLATPDGADLTTAENLEIKLAVFPHGKFGDDGTDDVPDPYLLQVQHQMLVTGATATVLPVYSPGRWFHVYRIPESKALQEQIESICTAWWQRHIVEQQPVILDGTEPHALESVKAVYNRVHKGKVVTLPDELEGLVKQLADVRQRRYQDSKTEKTIQTKLLQEIDDAEIAYVGNMIVNRYERHRSGYTVKPTDYVELRLKSAIQETQEILDTLTE